VESIVKVILLDLAKIYVYYKLYADILGFISMFIPPKSHKIVYFRAIPSQDEFPGMEKNMFFTSLAQVFTWKQGSLFGPENVRIYVSVCRIIN
jgi:hypothetical protein